MARRNDRYQEWLTEEEVEGFIFECHEDDEESEPEEAPPVRKRRKRGQRNRDLGARGEEAAARFLVRRGYDIL